MKQATAAYLTDRNEEALKLYEDARRLFKIAQNGRGEANVLRGLGDLERKLGRDEEARKHYEDARRFFKDTQDRLGEASVLRGLGELERKLGRNEEARKHYEDARRLCKGEKNLLEEAKVLRSLGELERMLGRNEEARKHYEDARRLSKDVQDRQVEAGVLLGLGELEFKLGRDEEARKHYEDARRLFKDVQDRLGEANVLRSLGGLELKLGRNEEARKRYEDARRLFKDVQDRVGEANVLRSLGELERTLGRNEEARKYFEDARRLSKDVQDRLGEANALLGLGEVERTLGRNEEARKDYEDARRLYKDVEDRLGEANVLRSLGGLERTLGRTEQAQKNYRDASILYGAVGMVEQQAYASKKAIEKWDNSELGALSPLKLMSYFAGGLGIVLVGFGIRQWQRQKQQRISLPIKLRNDEVKLVQREWLHYDKAVDTSVVFVHGILSNPDAFRHDESHSWPEILYADSRAKRPNIFLAAYHTAADSGMYDITHAADELRVQLNLPDEQHRPGPIQSSTLVFIAHSTGGLVVRDMLTRSPELFRSKRIGLVLVASPSQGSVWANRLKLIIDLANNRMAEQLVKGNQVTGDLERRFADFVTKKTEARGFELFGIDLYENKFIAGNYPVLRYLIPTRTQVVSERNSTSYFDSGKIMGGTDHFSIAKPDSSKHPSHSFLMEWWLRHQI